MLQHCNTVLKESIAWGHFFFFILKYDCKLLLLYKRTHYILSFRLLILDHIYSMDPHQAQTNPLSKVHILTCPNLAWSLTHLWHWLWSRLCLCPRWCRRTGPNPWAWCHGSAAPPALSACGCCCPESCHLWSRWWSPSLAEGSWALALPPGALSTPWA